MTAPKNAVQTEPAAEPPSKRTRRSLEADESKEANGAELRSPQTRSSKKQDAPFSAETQRNTAKPSRAVSKTQTPEVQEGIEEEKEEEQQHPTDGPDEMTEDEVASVIGDADGYESPADTPIELQNFPLSKVRLSKSNIVYGDEDTLCVRIKEKTVCLHLFCR